ncbi:MAG: hypothetical protein K6F01_11520 [Selenomonas sp.]|uniref:hypothetical protein n=1 Tax=Selenomonas sp. TaxID=2053611 RepID=UPI0025E274D3|nr:hypothetical protein [Selenomonas sp.]MCR5440042.1 hypothetical protein [Selenomonas sp.]
MKKSAKLSLALALMMGTTAGVNMVAPSSASAEISDKFRMEVNGVTAYISDNHRLGGYSHQTSDTKDETSYSNTYTRLQLNYYQDKNTMYQVRLHSDYESLGTNYANLGKTGAYFDQSFLQVKDRKANTTYILGKKGAYLGQGLIHNSTGNLTGVQVSLGNWYDPQCFQMIAGKKKDGSNFWALQETYDVVKDVQLSATYLNHKLKQATNLNVNKEYDKPELHLVSVGTKAKAKAFTVQGEFIKNLSDYTKNGIYNATTKKVTPNRDGSSRKAWYVEVFTGPTSDMTSGLPLQKPGTNVWSLKYQDVGCNATDAHNTTFFDDAKGFRLNYGHTFKKGLAGDISIARMKDKGGNSDYDTHNGEWKTLFCAQVNYKFR